MNERIRISPIKVVGADGSMLGEMETAAALQLAIESGLDLVEVSAEARPPICRIMDYGKARFQKQKKSSGAKPHRVQLKEIRLRAKTGAHDIEVKVAQTRRFLCRGDRVKLTVVFRGRENAHHDRGRDMLTEVLKTLDDMAIVEQSPRMDSGRSMSALIKPKPGLSRIVKAQAPVEAAAASESAVGGD